MRFFAQHVLRGNRDARAKLARAGQSLVVGVGVQRLQAAQNAGHGLHRDAGDVVQRLLARQIDARGLGMELEAPGARVLGAKPIPRQASPDAPGRAKLGDFLKETDRDIEEEGEAWQELVRVHAACHAVLGVLDRGAKREGHRFGGCCARLLRVLANHRHRIPFRQKAIAELDVIGKDAPRTRQRNAEEHVVGHIVAQVVALVGRAADAFPVGAAPACRGQHEGQQCERGWVVLGAGYFGQIDALQGSVHV